MAYTELSLEFRGITKSFDDLMSFLKGQYHRRWVGLYENDTKKKSWHVPYEPSIYKVSMNVSDDCVVVYESHVVAGIHSNGKAYWRWSEDARTIYTFRGTFNGHKVLRVYGSTHGRPPFNQTYFPRRPNVNSVDLFKIRESIAEVYKKVYGREWVYGDGENIETTLKRMAFPCLSEELIKKTSTSFSRIPCVYGVQAETPAEAVKFIFGKTRYRKDLVKAFAQATSGAIETAHMLRGLVPVDYLVKVLRENQDWDIYGGAVQVRKTLKNFSQHQLMKLVKSGEGVPGDVSRLSNIGYLIRDIERAIQVIIEEEKDFDLTKIKFKDAKELHDTLASIARKITQKDRPIEPTKMSEKLDAVDWSKYGIEVRTAKSTHQVFDWGTEMGHCIGTYVNHALSGEVTLVGIYKGGKLIGNSSFSETYSAKHLDKKIQCDQILGKFNRHLPDGLANVFKDAIIEENILDESAFERVWGLDRSTVGMV